MMGLDTIELLDLLILYPSLDQSHLSKQGQHHRRCWCRCQAFVPWDLLVMGAQVQTNLSLDNAIDQQADHGEHRQGRNPFGFLEPHGSDSRRVLDPTKTRLYCGILLLIGFENLCVRTPLSTYRGGQHCPPIVDLSIGQGVHLYHEAIARLGRRRVGLRRTTPTGTARAATRCHEARAERVIPPGARPAPAAARSLTLIGGDGGLGIGPAGKPLGVHLPHVVGNGLRFLLLRTGIRLGMLLGQLTGMHDDKAPLLLGDPPRTVLDLDAAEYAVPMPTAWLFVLGPAGLLHEEGQGRVLAPPGLEFLPNGARPRD